MDQPPPSHNNLLSQQIYQRAHHRPHHGRHPPRRARSRHQNQREQRSLVWLADNRSASSADGSSARWVSPSPPTERPQSAPECNCWIPPTPRSARPHPLPTRSPPLISAHLRSPFASAIKRLLSQCDRVHPCNQCKRYDKTCVFPEAENPRRGKKSVHTQSSLFWLAPLANQTPFAHQAAFLNLHPLPTHCQCWPSTPADTHQIPRRGQGARRQA